MKFKSRGQTLPAKLKEPQVEEDIIPTGFGMKDVSAKKPKKIPIRNKQKFANFMANLKNKDAKNINEELKEAPKTTQHSSRDRSRKRQRQPPKTTQHSSR